MKTLCSRSLCALAVLALTAAVPASAGGFLTGPQEGDPLDLAVAYIEANADELGLSYEDLADFVVSDLYESRHNGVTHVYLQQRLVGVEVVNGILNVNVMSDGRILSLGNRFIGSLAAKANVLSPTLQPESAVGAALADRGISMVAAPALLEVIGGPASESRFDGSGLVQGDIGAKLNYLQTVDGARLVWSVRFDQLRTSDMWNIFVDAVSGEVLGRHNYTVHERGGVFSDARRTAGKPGPTATEGGGCGAGDCYHVFATPKESPNDGPRTYETDPADATASPFGWHDTNGATGAEFTDTRGNNVEAQTDLDANNNFGGPDVRSEGGAGLDFDEPLDLNLGPETYREFAVANLFYWNNIIHDMMYLYGFDEASGNFQQNNYGNGGNAGDPVQADAQDGSGCNNANFGTPSDGGDGRMQMFVWTGVPNAAFEVLSGTAAGEYSAAKGCWGGELSPPTVAVPEDVNDGTGTPTQGCNALIGFTPGNIALIDRGGCEFGVKAQNAETAGAVGAVIVNDDQNGPNAIISMGAGAVGDFVTIPAIMIGDIDGATVRSDLESSSMQPDTSGNVDRDSDLDAGIIAHEYGHGVSNRLTGGPTSVGCLQHPEQAGEGWSDWLTLALFPDPSDTATTARGVGTYSVFQPSDGAGIRNFPYTTDLGVNPQTYEDIGATNIPHGVGEIWAAMLWEVYWNLVDDLGFDPDLYNGTGGNNLAIQLVNDGMKLQPCVPTFVQARDAILAADTALTGGANQCAIWTGFAKRGLGFSATAGGTGVGDETEAFDLPSTCGTEIFTDGFESGDTSAWSNTIP